jgi:hypothetical protein
MLQQVLIFSKELSKNLRIDRAFVRLMADGVGIERKRTAAIRDAWSLGKNLGGWNCAGRKPGRASAVRA